MTRCAHELCPEMMSPLTHWGRVAHICVGSLTIIGSDNGLSPGRGQAIIWTNAGILLIGPWGTNFSETLIGIQTFSFKKMHLKMSSAKWRPVCLGLNLLNLVIYAIKRHKSWPALFQMMACCLFGVKPFSNPIDELMSFAALRRSLDTTWIKTR